MPSQDSQIWKPGVGMSGSSSTNAGVQGSAGSWFGVAGFSSFIGIYGNSGDRGLDDNFAKTRNGNIVVSFGATTTSPSVEDTGSAQRVNGIAMVKLDAAFAHAIDLGQAYHVMLTPDGDTRGVFSRARVPQGSSSEKCRAVAER